MLVIMKFISGRTLTPLGRQQRRGGSDYPSGGVVRRLKLNEMPRLLRLLASQAAGLLNYEALADRLQPHPDTIKSYFQLLETVFLVYRLPAWRPGLGTR